MSPLARLPIHHPPLFNPPSSIIPTSPLTMSSDQLCPNVRSALKRIEEVGIDSLLDASIMPRIVPNGRSTKRKAHLDEPDTTPLPPPSWPAPIILGLDNLIKHCSNPATIKAAIRQRVSLRQSDERIRRGIRIIREVTKLDIKFALNEIMADTKALATTTSTTSVCATTTYMTAYASSAPVTSENSALAASAPAVTSPASPPARVIAKAAPATKHELTSNSMLPAQVHEKQQSTFKTSHSAKPQPLSRPRSLLNSRWAPESQRLQVLAGPANRLTSEFQESASPDQHHQALVGPVDRLTPSLQASASPDLHIQVLARPVDCLGPNLQESVTPKQDLQAPVGPPAQLASDLQESTSLGQPLQALLGNPGDLGSGFQESASPDQHLQALVGPLAPMALKPKKATSSVQALVRLFEQLSLDSDFDNSGSKDQPLPALHGPHGRLSLEPQDPASVPVVELPTPQFRPTKKPVIQFGDVPPPRNGQSCLDDNEHASSLSIVKPRAHLSDEPTGNVEDYQLLLILQSYIDRLEIIKLLHRPDDILNESHQSALSSYLIAAVKLTDSTAELNTAATDALFTNYRDLLNFNRTWLAHWRLMIEESLRKL
ncbi:hypothetical protein HDK90DRAFT_465344 [Phyllosticta capitalensis]|uniref:Uncharacterized protein n=1 Tax=Phyllosticta capitalensis TaxID=121624 RepID=A0ABR1YV40_9PEZI